MVNPPRMTYDEAMQASAAKPAAKVTQGDMQEKIAQIEYFCPELEPTMTICLIKLRNGFILVGKSAPVSKENFDPDIGQRFAYDDAFKQLWMLEGYLMKERQWWHARAEAIDQA